MKLFDKNPEYWMEDGYINVCAAGNRGYYIIAKYRDYVLFIKDILSGRFNPVGIPGPDNSLRFIYKDGVELKNIPYIKK
jgi:hypothetical protein